MTPETLATYANYALWSATAVLTLAMLGHVLYLARAVPARGPEDAAQAAPPEPVGARQAAGIARSLTGLGALLLLLSIALRGAAVRRPPLGNLFEFSVAMAFFAVAAYLLWGLRRDLRWLGLFVTAPVVLLLGVATTVWYAEAAELVPSLKSFWLPIHVTVATLSVGIFVLGAALTALHLVARAREERGTRPTSGPWAALPSAAALERLAYGAHIVAFPLWTFTLIAGAIWARQAWGSYWNWDPKEVWTFVIWVVYAAYLHARVTRGSARRTASWIALAGFACIVINYTVVNFYFIGQHSYAQ